MVGEMENMPFSLKQPSETRICVLDLKDLLKMEGVDDAAFMDMLAEEGIAVAAGLGLVWEQYLAQRMLTGLFGFMKGADSEFHGQLLPDCPIA